MEKERNVYDKTPPEDVKIIYEARRLTRKYNSADPENAEEKESILKALFGSVGENVVIDTPFHCNYGRNIHIGNNVIININCTLIDDADISIGNNVLIASNVQIYTATHTPEPSDRIIENWKEKGTDWFRTYSDPVKINDGVWLGGGVIILPGVEIGENSVIGAGSVVTRSIPDNCVAVGNPCKPIRFFDDEKKM